MKTRTPRTPLFLCLLGLAVAAVPAVHADAAGAAASAQVEVIFDHPENFTDVRDGFFGTDKGRDGILDQLKDCVVREAPHDIPAGSRLVVKFTDIDLAGDFEPARGPQFDSVRIIRDIYPPRASLEFRLTDARGQVLKEGRRELRNLSFQSDSLTLPSGDPLRYDKQLLINWLRAEFTRK